MKGKVKFFNEQKGFGFILGEDEQDYFVHISQITNDSILDNETEVVFEAKETERGKQAVNVSCC